MIFSSATSAAAPSHQGMAFVIDRQRPALVLGAHIHLALVSGQARQPQIRKLGCAIPDFRADMLHKACL